MATQIFREAFHHDKIIQWFPGHMAKGLRIMKQKLSKVDLILEVRDARVSSK
jgi:ribosome biogenesis GTPase A